MMAERPKTLAHHKREEVREEERQVRAGGCRCPVAIFAVKADGSKQLFQKEKIVRTCINMGASRETAAAVADKIERRSYDGISTKRILQMIFAELGRILPSVRRHIDLRAALGMLSSKPDFELFVQALLREHGYDVTSSQIVRGKCVEHEVDGVARKQGKIYIVEAKHHFDHHTLTGLDIPRIARAIVEDVAEGYKMGKTSLNVDKAIVICNTKYSEHAMRYAECREIEQIGWGYPPRQGIDKMISDKKLYPITYLKNLTESQRNRLANEGIILLKEVAASDPARLCQRTKLPKSVISELINDARLVLSDSSISSDI